MVLSSSSFSDFQNFFFRQVKCLRESGNPTKSSKAMGRDLRVHFKNTAHVIGKLPLFKAKRYRDNVIAYKQVISFTRYCRGVGCTALAKNRRLNGLGLWPVKSAR